MPDSAPRQQEHTSLPRRPEGSSLAALLRRKINRVFFPYLFGWPLPVLALMCVFAREADTVLGIFGYSDDFASSFPFIKALYRNVASTRSLGTIDIGYFHILDATLWVAIIAWTIWLIAGIVLLKEYDRVVFSALLLPRFRRSRFLIDLMMLVTLPFFLLGAHSIAQPKLMTSPEIF
jgi:hypothetical protein